MKDPSGRRFASEAVAASVPLSGRRRPLQERAQVTREAILDATLQVLLRDGYAALTTTRVAERAGVSVGTLYQYFDDKRGLTLALIERYVGWMHGAVADALVGSAGLSAEDTLRRALWALLSVKLTRLDLVVALRTPMVELGGEEVVRGSLVGFATLLAPLLQAELGTAASEDEVARRSFLLVNAIEGVITATATTHPAWLGEPWFLDDLVALGASLVGRRGAGSR